MVLKAVVKDGRIELNVPEDWPDGMEVTVVQAESETIDLNNIGLDESEWDDSPEGREAWNARLDTLEPIDWPEPDEYDELNRQYNLDAVRKQWENNYE